MNYTELESDLNSALSMLNSEMKELQADQEVLEKFETQITQTVMETRGGNGSDTSFEGVCVTVCVCVCMHVCECD